MIRAGTTLPSVTRHLLLAVGVLAIAGGAVAYALSRPVPEAIVASMDLPERVLPPRADTLLADTDEAALPDLLQGLVADGENPTEGLVGVAKAPTPAPAPKPQVLSMMPNRPAPLVRAPIDALQSPSRFGFVPTRGDDGRTAFRAYARPFSDTDKPNLSVVVGGLGINAEMTRRAVEELPPEITLAFAAHAPNLQGQIDAAREWGHEVVLEVPMEGTTIDPSEPGADRMLRVDSADDSARNLDFLLSRAAGYFAVVPYQGDVFLARTDAVAPMLSALGDAGLGFLGDPQVDVPTISATAEAAQVPYRAGSQLIDETPTAEAIARDLERLRAAALAGKRPIGFGFAYPETIDALILFAPTLSKAELAPASSAFP